MWFFYYNFVAGFTGKPFTTLTTMQRADIKEKDYDALLGRIIPIILKNGLKQTTMDSVAAALGMSKRTLYEIFESKSEMIMEVIGAMERQRQDYVSHAFKTSDNVMEALIMIFKHNRDIIGSVNVNFYRDMDRLYKDKRAMYDKTSETRHEQMLRMFMLGVEQGMFRPDVDYKVQSRIMSLQMEALKRIEELFPPEIPLIRVFDGVILGFLRSIASEKGMRILDRLTTEIN